MTTELIEQMACVLVIAVGLAAWLAPRPLRRIARIRRDRS